MFGALGLYVQGFSISDLGLAFWGGFRSQEGLGF